MQTGRSAVIRVIREAWLKTNKFARAEKTGKATVWNIEKRSQES